MLGRSIDSKLSSLPGLTRQSEAQTLLYASLLLADELHERADAPPPAPPPAPPERQDNAAIAEPLERLAQKLESLAAELESAARRS